MGFPLHVLNRGYNLLSSDFKALKKNAGCTRRMHAEWGLSFNLLSFTKPLSLNIKPYIVLWAVAQLFCIYAVWLYCSDMSFSKPPHPNLFSRLCGVGIFMGHFHTIQYDWQKSGHYVASRCPLSRIVCISYMDTEWPYRPTQWPQRGSLRGSVDGWMDTLYVLLTDCECLHCSQTSIASYEKGSVCLL